tara:strand:+ start:602 stop:1096 length:495 start_codon:yes stop_codon:yes gene_type:complete
MRNIILGILLLSILVLAGCSTQTVVKYQCADGSIKESISNCPQLQEENNKVTTSDFNIDNYRSNIANVIESQDASISKIVFNSGVLEIEYTSKWAGEDMVVREEFDIFKAVTDEVKNTKGISKIKVSAVASMGDIYSVDLSFDNALKTINYEMGFEDWKSYVRG